MGLESIGLMAKTSMQEYHSGFAETDAEVVTPDE
jgi:hypothetical protein